VYRSRHSIGKKPDSAAPEGLNYDIWQGPAQARPFNENIVPYNWHWHWAYGNGEIGNQGIHELDMCLWGLSESELPTKVSSKGSRYFDDDRETPDILSTQCQFRSGTTMTVEVRPWKHGAEFNTPVGNVFYGTEGVMLVRDYDEFRILLGKERSPGPHGRAAGNHFQNFVDAVRARDRSILNAPVETAHFSSGVAHLANISYRLGRELNFDPASERFVGDDEADKLRSRAYRHPFEVPERV